MSFSEFFKKNGNYILSALSVAGTVASIVLTAKITPKAVQRKEELKKQKGDNFTKKDAVISDVKSYAPVIATGIGTVASIIGNTILSNRQQASLIGLYTFANASYGKYKDKINSALEKAGLKDKIEEDIARQDARDMGLSISDDKPDTILVYDMFTLSYIETTMDELLTAEHYINERVRKYGRCSVIDFYRHLDIDVIFKNYYEEEYPINMQDLWWIDDEVHFWHRRVCIDENFYILMLSFEDPQLL